MASIYRRPYDNYGEKDKNVMEADNGGGRDPNAEALNERARAAAERASQQYAQERQAPAMPTYGYVPSSFGYQYTYKPTQFQYNSQYADLINAASERLRNWNYNPDEDVSYNAYKNQYTRGGQQAMTDALARYASRTGGVASSYAASAAQQQYNNYMAQLAAKVPELEKLAYGRAVDELDYYTNADNTAYGRAFNEYSDWENRRRQQADTEYDIAYRAWQSSENAREQAARNAYNAALAQWEAQNGGGSNSSRTTNRTSVTNNTVVKPSGRATSDTNSFASRNEANREEYNKQYDSFKSDVTKRLDKLDQRDKVPYLVSLLNDGNETSSNRLTDADFQYLIDTNYLGDEYEKYLDQQRWRNRLSGAYDWLMNWGR